MEYLLDCLENDPRTYNSRQLAHKLKQERWVDLSGDRLRRILKKKRCRWKRTRASHGAKQDPVKKALKQADLQMLIQAAEGEIELKYLDETGCCLESPVSCSYSQIGQQKQMEQPLEKYGKRVSILGLWQPGQSFEYALAQGGFNSQSYIKFMDGVAHKAARTLAETGRITVAVKDNGSLQPVCCLSNNGLVGKSRDYTFSFCLLTVRK